MINTNYSNLYGQYWAGKNNTRTNGRVKDKSQMSESMAYLEKAKAETEKAKKAAQPAKSDAASASKNTDELTREDIRKLYAKLNGISYGDYDEEDSYRSMANTFLNEMVFSPMSSSKELFIPQMSRSVLSAAFNAAYDSSRTIDRIKENYDAAETDETKATDEPT